MKRLLLGAAVAAAIAGAGARPALAWDDWCQDEPPVTVVTPAGHHVTINNYLAAPVQYRHDLQRATLTGTATTAGPGETLVTIRVHFPTHADSQVRVTSFSHVYQTSMTKDGNLYQDFVVKLTLPVD